MVPPETAGAALPEACACPTATPPTIDPAAANAAAHRTNPNLIVPSLAYEAPHERPPVPTMTSVCSDPKLTQVSSNKNSGLGQVGERSVKVRNVRDAAVLLARWIAETHSFVARRGSDVLHRCL